MNTQRISKTVEDRIELATGGDVAWRAAEDALYAAFGKVAALDRALEEELTFAWVDALNETQRVAWWDGWQCGRNPDLLVTFVSEVAR